MGSASVEINLKEIDKLARKIRDFELSGGDKRRLLSSLGEVVEEQTKDRIEITKKNPEGDIWKEITEAYKKRKKAETRGGTLVWTSDLLKGIENQLTGSDTVLVGSPEEYAGYHQNARDKKRRRKFLGLSTENIEELQFSVDEFLRGHVA